MVLINAKQILPYHIRLLSLSLCHNYTHFELSSLRDRHISTSKDTTNSIPTISLGFSADFNIAFYSPIFSPRVLNFVVSLFKVKANSKDSMIKGITTILLNKTIAIELPCRLISFNSNGGRLLDNSSQELCLIL